MRDTKDRDGAQGNVESERLVVRIKARSPYAYTLRYAYETSPAAKEEHRIK